jgi:hypothetical protein
MDTPQTSAGRAGVGRGLMRQKRFYSLLLDLDQVGDHAHPVFGTISCIQLFQPFAGNLLALIAEVGWICSDGWAGTDDAFTTAVRFIGILSPTTRTCSFRALEGQAYRAVHSTRSNHLRL